MYVIIKIIVSALVIKIVIEIARRFPSYGGIIAALPIISLLSIIWFYVQGEQATTLTKFTLGVIWGIPATLGFLWIIYIALQKSLHLFIAIGLEVGGIILVGVQNLLVKMVKVYFNF